MYKILPIFLVILFATISTCSAQTPSANYVAEITHDGAHTISVASINSSGTGVGIIDTENTSDGSLSFATHPFRFTSSGALEDLSPAIGFTAQPFNIADNGSISYAVFGKPIRCFTFDSTSSNVTAISCPLNISVRASRTTSYLSLGNGIQFVSVSGNNKTGYFLNVTGSYRNLKQRGNTRIRILNGDPKAGRPIVSLDAVLSSTKLLLFINAMNEPGTERVFPRIYDVKQRRFLNVAAPSAVTNANYIAKGGVDKSGNFLLAYALESGKKLNDILFQYAGAGKYRVEENFSSTDAQKHLLLNASGSLFTSYFSESASGLLVPHSELVVRDNTGSSVAVPLDQEISNHAAQSIASANGLLLSGPFSNGYAVVRTYQSSDGGYYASSDFLLQVK